MKPTTYIRPTSELAKAFLRYHREHPEVYDKLVSLARNLKKHNMTAGIGTLWEVMRHDFMLQADGKPLSGSNSYRSRYARLIMYQEADLEGFFKTRELPSERVTYKSSTLADDWI